MHSEIAGLATVSKNYGSPRALDAIDLTVGKGEILALLEPEWGGAGKTIAVKLLLGLLDPDAGTARSLAKIRAKPARPRTISP